MKPFDFAHYFKSQAGIKIFITAFLFTVFIWVFFVSLTPPAIWEYSDIAKNLIKNHTFSIVHLNTEYLCFCAPLYPFLVAFVYMVSAYNNLAVILLQIIIFSFLCVLVFKIAKNIFNYKIGIIASIILLFHPGMLFYVLKNEHTLILDVTMLAFSVYLILLLRDKPVSISKGIAVGVVLGLTFLSRGTVCVLLPISVVWCLYTFNIAVKKRIIICAVFILAAFLVILPWTIRNYAVRKTLVFVGAAVEESLWRGNNINASGSSYDSSGKRIFDDLVDKDFLKKIYSQDEMGQRKIFRETAFDFIKNNPGKFARLFIKKLYYFWWFSPQSGILYPKYYIPFYKILYFMNLSLGIIGILSALYSRNKILIEKSALILLTLFFISVIQSLFYVDGRHRLAIEPLMLVFTANGIIYAASRIIGWAENVKKS